MRSPKGALTVIRDESVRRLHASELAVQRQFNQARLLATLAIGLVLVGFLLVAQWRGTTTQARILERQRPQDMALIVQEINDENEALRAEAARLQARVLEGYQAGRGRVEMLNRAAEELESLRVMAGLAAATGPGVAVTIVDQRGVLVPQDFVDMIHELRSSGAEAIAVEGIRLGPRSGFGGTQGELTLDGVPLAPDYAIEAIGDPASLRQAFTLPGGLGSRLEAFAGVDVLLEIDDAIVLSSSRPAKLAGEDEG